MEANDQFPYGQSFEWGGRIFLGQGSYGKVFKARSLKDNQFYAIKQMKMEEFNRDQTLMNSLLGQIKITMEVNSEHTVKMIDAKIGKNYTYILLELCDTDLRKELASKKFSEQEAVQAFQQIMKGFQVLVGKGYIHRDVKPANTLVKGKVYKVADFGFACKADILGRKKITDICGTPIYMAPQLLKNQPYTAKSDIWSLGLMFYQMIFGYPPWPCRSLQEYLYGICNKSLSFPYNAKIGQNTKDFLVKALVVNEEQRMTWAQVFNHPLIKHQQAGANIKQISVDDYVINILRKLQEYLLKHQVNLGSYASKYSQGNIDINIFTKLIKEVNPFITTHEIQVLFDYFDSKKLGTIDWRVLERRLIQVDYRSEDDIFSRKLDQIVAILKDRKIDPQTYFDKIDLNHSGSLDFTQFSNFIASIAPCYTKQQVLQIFKLFDNDKNGLISKKQFLQLISRKFPSVHGVSEHAFQKERAERNLKLLKGYIKFYNMSPESIVKLADKNSNKTVDLSEFGDLIVNRFKFKISQEELQQLFVRINKNQDNTLSTIQFIEALQ